ncbi:hypothetical protein HanIR_Chr07g0314701 [Helianthus annuus]|nr:hypothetical protein HanIR_Chr07g0314701 [Helianthus annuus]
MLQVLGRIGWLLLSSIKSLASLDVYKSVEQCSFYFDPPVDPLQPFL